MCKQILQGLIFVHESLQIKYDDLASDAILVSMDGHDKVGTSIEELFPSPLAYVTQGIWGNGHYSEL